MKDHSKAKLGGPTRRNVLTTAVGIAASMTLTNATPAEGILADFHDNRRGTRIMSTITAKDGTEIYYKDWGTGPVVTFSHGWPLNSDAWDGQMLFLAQNGYRSVAVDRRGHGRSSQASAHNDMDGYADDLAAVIDALDLKDATLVGHSTGGCAIPPHNRSHRHKPGQKAGP